MKRKIYCRLCGKSAKVTAKQSLLWSHNKVVMYRSDGPFGGWECSDGCGCKKIKTKI
jgi:hypothetical protein